MPGTTPRSVLKGAAIVATGGLLSRGLGAVYRFFLPLILGGGERAQVVIGLFNLVYPMYTALLGMAVGGIPFAVAKLVAESTARGDRCSAAAVFRHARWILAAAGLACGGALAVSASSLATHVYLDERATLSILAVAPAVLLVAVASAYRGYFQGLQAMTPYAVSQVWDQGVRVASILLLAWLLLPYGVQWSAAGASFGAATGGLAALVYLVLELRRHPAVPEVDPSSAVPPARVVLREIVALAVPMSLVGTVMPLMNIIDSVVVPGRLHAAGLGDRATALYGLLTGYALPFIIAPTLVTAALATSLVPAVSQAAAVGDLEGVRRHQDASLRVTLFLVLPSAVGLMALAREIPVLFFNEPAAGLPLLLLAPGAVFLGLQQVVSAVLQGMGAVTWPVYALLAGAAVKLALTWVLVADPALNVGGAALATSAGFAVAAVASAWRVQRLLGARIPWGRLGGAALAAAVAMGVLVRLTQPLLAGMLGVRLGALGGVALGALAYGLLALFFGAVRERDLRAVPRLGDALASILGRWGLLRR